MSGTGLYGLAGFHADPPAVQGLLFGQEAINKRNSDTALMRLATFPPA